MVVPLVFLYFEVYCYWEQNVSYHRHRSMELIAVWVFRYECRTFSRFTHKRKHVLCDLIDYSVFLDDSGNGCGNPHVSVASRRVCTGSEGVEGGGGGVAKLWPISCVDSSVSHFRSPRQKCMAEMTAIVTRYNSFFRSVTVAF